MTSSHRWLALFIFAIVAALASAKEFFPAIVYDFGGKFDRSFNQSASEGAQKFKRDTGIAFREFEITNAAQREQIMAQSAKRGADIIVAVGFTQASAVEKVARMSGLDVGGIEYMIDDRDGRAKFYDLNAMSNFVAKPLEVLGWDPHDRLVDYLLTQIAARQKVAA